MRGFFIFLITGLFLLAEPVLSFTNLTVPFTPQAPQADWSQPWQDACEESSILMVDHFYASKTLDTETARQGILQVLKIKNGYFGWSYDENADKIVSLINNFFPWEAKKIQNPTREQIKQEIDNGRPVILPTYGKALYNPFFLRGGPFYHVGVISGYDDKTQEFIVQEPGTRRGLDFRYSYDRIETAMHDFLPFGQTMYGDKVVIFTSPNIDISLDTDGDHDGLTKGKELLYGSILWLSDSDGDGYTDGQEVSYGFSPTQPSKKLSTSMLAKTPEDPKVYIIENGSKRHIPNEEVFLRHGWRWTDINIIDKSIMSTLESGEPVS